MYIKKEYKIITQNNFHNLLTKLYKVYFLISQIKNYFFVKKNMKLKSCIRLSNIEFY